MSFYMRFEVPWRPQRSTTHGRVLAVTSLAKKFPGRKVTTS